MDIRFNEDFVKQMYSILGKEDGDLFFESYNKLPLRVLNLNTPRITPEIERHILKNYMYREIDGVVYDSEYDTLHNFSTFSGSPGKDILHEQGIYYIQEPDAKAVVYNLLRAQDLDKVKQFYVLDLCAAPGGKSVGISSILGSSGLLFSNDINYDRARVLSSNIERMGLSNVVVISMSPTDLKKKFPNFFDFVFVDAPCSCEGMFRKDPETIKQWSLKNVESCAKRSYSILCDAFDMVKPNGYLVYSTCTFNTKENEENIINFVDSHENAKLSMPLVPSNMSYSRGVNIDSRDLSDYFVRLYPHHDAGEGHFIACIKKNSDLENSNRLINPRLDYNRRAVDAFTQFVLKYFNDFPFEDYAYVSMGDELYLMPYNINLDGLKVLRAGIHLGTFTNNIFTPSHALSHVILPKHFRYTIDLNEDQAIKYIAGEELHDFPDLENGWILLTYLNESLAFGKVTNGVIKNHYPKGLRKKLTKMGTF